MIAPALAVAGAQVGYIKELNRGSGQYELIRGREKLGVEILMPLNEGDRLELKACGPSVEGKTEQQFAILDMGGESIRVSCSNQPFRVKKIKRSIWINLSDELRTQWNDVASRLLTQLHDERISSELVHLRVRGPDAGDKSTLELLLVPTGVALLVAGKRDLSLSWVGGIAPFRVLIEDKGGGKPLVDKETYDQRRVALEALRFRLGRSYRIEIIDKHGAQVSGNIQTVRPSDMPLCPGTDSGSSGALVTDPAIQTLLAECLVKTDSDWSLEAYQKTHTIASHYPPADLLSLHLEGSL